MAVVQPRSIAAARAVRARLVSEWRRQALSLRRRGRPGDLAAAARLEKMAGELPRKPQRFLARPESAYELTDTLFADFDTEAPPEALLSAMGWLGDRAYAVLWTGGGYHVLWKLDRPVPLSSAISAMRRRLEEMAWLGADVQATNPSSMVRIPGSLNTRRGVRVRLLIWRDEVLPWEALREHELKG